MGRIAKWLRHGSETNAAHWHRANDIGPLLAFSPTVDASTFGNARDLVNVNEVRYDALVDALTNFLEHGPVKDDIISMLR